MAISKLHNKAEYEASALLEKFNISKPPVAIDKIVKGLELSLVPYEFDDEVSGVLILDDRTGVISYNSAHKPNRQRFTIAHELGHYVLHRKSERLFIDKDFIVKYRSNKNYDTTEMQQEQQANAFAAAILMPLNLLQDELKKPKFRKLDEATLIEQLAELFKVSSLAMTYRLSNIMQFSEKW